MEGRIEMTAKNRWDERRAYDEAHAKQVRNAKDYTRLEEENRRLRERIKELEDIQSGSGCICGVYMKKEQEND